VIHLFERECSVQRRHQKVIEETPSPIMTPKVREEMGAHAVAVAKAANYSGAGTIEFIVDDKLNYYFLEMNTRLQVEHPITERVVGIDLVKEQINIANGLKLTYKQKDLRQNGHAIECRIYAEDPENNFMPSPGTMTFYQQPAGENIRVDTGIEKATTIYSFFDPMISKMVVWGKNRNEAINKSVDALNDYIIHGIQTNIEFLSQVLQHKAFKKNHISTRFCDEHSTKLLDAIRKSKSGTNKAIPLLAASLYAINVSKLNTHANTWEKIGYWRNLIRFFFSDKESTNAVDLISTHKTDYQFNIESKKFNASLIEITKNFVSFFMDKKKYDAFISADTKGIYFITIQGNHFKLKRNDVLDSTETSSSGTSGEGGNNLFAPMPGKVLVINVKEGQKVKRGTVLLVVEAMKMENNIVAGTDAVIEKVNVKEGEMVDTDKQLVQLKISTFKT
jgi:3-methylcrotonyl-CoA carboxylase alpha subunit